MTSKYNEYGQGVNELNTSKILLLDPNEVLKKAIQEYPRLEDIADSQKTRFLDLVNSINLLLPYLRNPDNIRKLCDILLIADSSSNQQHIQFMCVISKLLLDLADRIEKDMKHTPNIRRNSLFEFDLKRIFENPHLPH